MMKRNMIRLAKLLCALPVSGMVVAHLGHEYVGGVSHHLFGVDKLAVIIVLGLVVTCGWVLARRQR